MAEVIFVIDAVTAMCKILAASPAADGTRRYHRRDVCSGLVLHRSLHTVRRLGNVCSRETHSRRER